MTIRAIRTTLRAIKPKPGKQPDGARPLPLSLVIRLAVVGGAMTATGWSTAVQGQGTGVAQPTADVAKRYDIAAGPLGTVLSKFSIASGVLLAGSAELVQGRSSPGLSGSYAPEAAIMALLSGTGLTAVRQTNGTYALKAMPAAAAQEQAPSSESALPAVIVSASAWTESADGPVSGYVAKRSSTGAKTDTPIIETPQSISVIGREELEARGAQDIMVVVRYTPGVATNVYGPDNRGWEDISIRGLPSYQSTYQNGLLQMSYDISYFLSDPYMFERVEVLRGPSSALYGQGDAGGIINRQTKMANGERIREIQVQYGSYQRKQIALDIGDRFGQDSDLSYRLIGVGLDSNDQDRYPDGHKLNRKRTALAPSLRWRPNARTSFTVYGEYIDHRTGEDPYYMNDLQRHITSVKMGDYSFSHMAQDQTSIGWKLEHQLADGWTLRNNYRASRIDIDRRVVWYDQIDPDDGRTIYRTARTWDESQRQQAMDTNLQGRFKTGPVAHTLLAGVDLHELKGSTRQFTGPAPNLDLLAPVYGQAIAYPTTPLRDARQSTRLMGFYLQDQLRFDDRWVLTLGGREDRVRQSTDDVLNASNTAQRDSRFSGRAGLTYLMGNGVAPYISYAESFLPTAGFGTNGDPFKPTRGKQTEVGVKYQPAGAKLLVTAALYDLRKTNLVSYDPVTYEGRQIGEVRSRGVELEAKAELSRGLNLTASITRGGTKVLASSNPDELGKRLPVVPEKLASAWLDYTMSNGFGFGGGVRYIGNSAGDEYNTFFSPSYTLADAVAHYERGPWRIALNVSNLFDRKFISGCYVDTCYAGQRRSAVLTARYTF